MKGSCENATLTMCNVGGCSSVGGWLLVQFSVHPIKSMPKAVCMLGDHEAVYSRLHTLAFSLLLFPLLLAHTLSCKHGA